MEGSQIGMLVTRLWLLLCACVVLGLSADLANNLKHLQDLCKHVASGRDCQLAGLIPDTEYSAFTGAWGLVQVIVGFVGVFAAIPWLAILVVDVLALLFYFVAGIVLAVWLGKHPCDDNNICSKLKADDAFAWLGFLGTLAAVALVFVWQRKR